MHNTFLILHATEDEIYSSLSLPLSLSLPFFNSLTRLVLSHTHTHENSKTLEETPSSREAICRASGTRSFRGEATFACVRATLSLVYRLIKFSRRCFAKNPPFSVPRRRGGEEGRKEGRKGEREGNACVRDKSDH